MISIFYYINKNINITLIYSFDNIIASCLLAKHRFKIDIKKTCLISELLKTQYLLGEFSQGSLKKFTEYNINIRSRVDIIVSTNSRT